MTMRDGPLAVWDIDMLRPIAPQSAEGCVGALVILRLGDRPCGQALLRFDEDADMPLRERLLRRANSSFLEAWTNHALGLAPARASPCVSAQISICTRDRPEDLATCLEALSALPDDGQTILVIDNAPSDDRSRDVVARFSKVAYVREMRPGLNNARNRALKEAKADIVAFIDDDATPDRYWIRNLARNFDDPLIMAATGLTLAKELNTDAQRAFERLGGLARGFKRKIYNGDAINPFDAWHAGAGVNMAFRREMPEKVGWFDPVLCSGTPTLAAGETDMFRCILGAGYRIAYDPEALSWHRHRRAMADVERQIYAYEVGAFALITKALRREGNLGAFEQALRWLRYETPALVKSFFGQKSELPFNAALLHWRGALAGPGRYWRARREARHARRGVAARQQYHADA